MYEANMNKKYGKSKHKRNSSKDYAFKTEYQIILLYLHEIKQLTNILYDMRITTIFFIVCCCLALFPANGYTQSTTGKQKIYYNAFSHNDYERDKPLFDALSYGFNCVEADLWLIDGELYVSHDKPEPKPEITFEKLYLLPLVERIKSNKGKVYTNGKKPFFLMVDCKTNGEEMLPVLKKKMEPYKELFCTVKNGKMKKSAVLFFLSGDSPKKSILSASEGFIFLDGRIDDLGKNIPTNLMPVVSDNYAKYMTWKGEGEIPADQLEKMRAFIRQAHKEGKMFRWWGAPDTPQFKQFFIKENVDLIGADDLKALHDLMNK